MLADFFTKPLQGRKFHLFRNILMEYASIRSLNDADTSIKERVEIINENRNVSEESSIIQRSYADVVKGANAGNQKFSDLSDTKQ